MSDSRRPRSAADARAEVEARRAEASSAREETLAAAFPGPVPGAPIRWVSWIGTVAQTVVSVAAVVDPDRFLTTFFVVSMALFLLGMLVLAIDVLMAVARSRYDLMGIGGLFFLVGCAPKAARTSLNASLGVALVVAVAATVARLSTPELAFGTLAPLFQLGMTGLWGVRHGHFPPRSADSPRQDARRG